MTAPVPPPMFARGALIFQQPDVDVFYLAGHLSQREAITAAENPELVGFTAVLTNYRAVQVFRPEIPGLDWAQGHGWREAITPEELARTDLLEATRIWVRETWFARGRRVVISP